MSRVYNENIKIDSLKIKEFYKKRFDEKLDIDVDAPVVLCGDKDKNKIEEWTSFEIKNRIPLLDLSERSKVLELGCGTGRISKFIINNNPKLYIGIDYVKEFIDLAKSREDIKKGENISFKNKSIKELINTDEEILDGMKFNRFLISGGVFMYINDEEVVEFLTKLVRNFEENSIIYISEPISIEERLTLDEFYSENLGSRYSAIYRTIDEYRKIFKVLEDAGFKWEVNEEFFYEDIKKQKETKQWLFILKR